MKSFQSFILFLLIFACAPKKPAEPVTPQQIEAAISNGLFSKAEGLIKEYVSSRALPYKEQQKWLFQIEKMNRIRMDFMATDSSVLGFIQNYYEDTISKQQIRIWEEGKALEYKIIDGKKRYFNNAARNLFRISLTAGKQWEKVHGKKADSLERFLTHYLPQVVKTAQTSRSALVDPQTMRVTFTLTVQPNAVPAGELVRVWMPFPRSDVRRQGDVHLISLSQPNYVVSPDFHPQNSSAHKSIYMEKRAIMDQPTVFSYTFSYTSYAEWFDFNSTDIKLYNTQSDIYQDFTREQAPHILFSERIKERTREVVGNEQNPYLKVRKIYDWIDRNFPWASAREYSTIDNIPEYVLDNNHGDCGQVSLLFITMARCAGIPAKWQSGWMMHPGNKNLHDWAEVYFEGIGWVPVDQSFGRQKWSQQPNVYWYYTKGIDAYRLIVNQDIGRDLYPVKVHPRSETVDFQRGEVEWRGGNLYYDRWRYNMSIEYLDAPATVSGGMTATIKSTEKLGSKREGSGTQKQSGANVGTLKSEENFGSINQRSYLRETERPQPYPEEQLTPPARDNYYRYDPYLSGSYQYDPYPRDSYRTDTYQNSQNRNDPSQNNPYRSDPYQNNPYRNDPYQNNLNRTDPYQGNPYRNDPYQNNPYRNAPYQNNLNRTDPYQNNPYRTDPYQNNPYRTEPNQSNSYRYDPSQFDSFRYNSQYNNSFPRNEDPSVSTQYPFLNAPRTQDRYVPPSERSAFPSTGAYPSYRKDLREEQGNNPQTNQRTSSNTPYSR